MRVQKRVTIRLERIGMCQQEGPEAAHAQAVGQNERIVTWQKAGTEDITSMSGSQERTAAEHIIRKETPEAMLRTVSVLPADSRYISSLNPGIAGHSGRQAIRPSSYRTQRRSLRFCLGEPPAGQTEGQYPIHECLVRHADPAR